MAQPAAVTVPDLGAATDEEITRLWEVEPSLTVRDGIYMEMERRGLFPAIRDSWEADAGLYPDTEDPRFVEKLLMKQEFAETLQQSLQDQQRSGRTQCDSGGEFEISPAQRLISRFLSPQCPYASLLLFHGVGVGKTCTAITTAETYLRTYPHQSVLIIAPRNIHSGFRRTIFDEETLHIGTEDAEANTATGCTGNDYLKRTGTEFERDRGVIVRRITQAINKRYTILGYYQFYSYIQELIDRVPKSISDRERREQEIARILSDHFSDRMIIIDEAHNLRDAPIETDDDNLDVAGGDLELTEAKAGKRLTPNLRRVLSAAQGSKLMLLTATPMYNDYREITFLLDLLLLNDKKDKRISLSGRDVFKRPTELRDADGTTSVFTFTGKKRLGNVARAYVSFLRGENPLTFPLRLKPVGIPLLATWPVKDPKGADIVAAAAAAPEPGRQTIPQMLLNLPFVPVAFGGAALDRLRSLSERLTETGLGIQNLNSLVQAANWLYPGTGSVQDNGFDETFEESQTGTLSSYELQTPGSWLAKSELAAVSPKAALILNRIPSTEGVIFVYSRFIKSGALPLALALEANGYTPFGRDKPLFLGGILDGRGRQCALCPKRERAHFGAQEKGIEKHEFVPAKYVLLTGKANLSPNNAAAIRAARSEGNKDGRLVKVVIGSQVASEGIDLRFVREIYVFDSWYHLNKLEQVLGRGVRTCSHALLPAPKRNCTIHLLVNTFTDRETADLYMYRSAFSKALQVGQVTRVLKETAFDCNLNFAVNHVQNLKPVTTIQDSQRDPRPPQALTDTPYTSICDWMECPYTCSVRVPVREELEKARADRPTDPSRLSFATYDEYAMHWREAQIKREIARFMETNRQPLIQIESLLTILKQKGVPELAVRTVLADIVDRPSFRIHVGSQEGYLIYRNGFYLFQPIALADVRIPIALRVAAVPTLKDVYEPRKLVTVGPAAAAAAAEGAPVPAAAPVAPPVAAATGPTFEAYWTACTTWAAAIESDASPLDIPDYVQTAIEARYRGEDYRYEYDSLTIVSWMIEHLRAATYPAEQVTAYRKALAQAYLEMIWDGRLTSAEQQSLVKSAPDVAREQAVKKGSYEAFRYVNTLTGAIEYLCGAEKCSPALVRQFEQDTADPLAGIQANRTNTARIYGFLIPKPKDNRLVFKTNDRPVDPGTAPAKGGECAIVTQIETHKKQLREIRAMIAERGYPEFILSDDVLNSKERMKEAAVAVVAAKKKKKAGQATDAETDLARVELERTKTKLRAENRLFQNVSKACTLKNLILRMIDILEKGRAGGKRHFYRPVAAIKTQHKLK